MEVFQGLYAEAYDLFYREKDYKAECDFLGKLFSNKREGEVRTVLDLGCGTGGHAIELARRGFQVVGVDISVEMLSRAKERARQAGVQIDFCHHDVRTMQLHDSFDASIAMFAVVGY